MDEIVPGANDVAQKLCDRLAKGSSCVADASSASNPPLEEESMGSDYDVTN